MDFLDSSLFLRGSTALWRRVERAAKHSLLLGGMRRHARAEAPRAAHFHPIERFEAAVGRSRILGGLYRYRADLAAGNVAAAGWLFFFLFIIMSARMLAAGRYPLGGALAAGAALALLALRLKGSWREWLAASLWGRYLPCPAGTPRRAITMWLAVCGVLGGLVGWRWGLVYGGACAIGAAVLPALVSVPPVCTLALLCFILPLGGTTLCWALSAALCVHYLFARACGGLAPLPIDRADRLLAVFPLFCLASAATSFHRGDSAKVAFLWIGLFLCVFAVKRTVRTRRQLLTVLGALTAGAVCSGFYGLYQYLSGSTNTVWTDMDFFSGIRLRVYGTFANPNVFGEFLLLMIPLVTSLALYAKRPWLRALLGAADLLLLANLALSYSRGCYVGLALTALVFLWRYSKKRMLALLIPGVPLALVLMPAGVMERIASIGDRGDSSTDYRLMIYIGVLLLLRVHWLGGVGLGEKAFNAVYPFYCLSGIVAPHAHSLFFQLVLSFGAAGLLYLLVTLAFYQRRVTATGDLPRRDRLLMLGFGALMWGFALQSVFDYTWYNYRVFQLFWIILALGITAPAALKEGGAFHGSKT